MPGQGGQAQAGGDPRHTLGTPQHPPREPRRRLSERSTCGLAGGWGSRLPGEHGLAGTQGLYWGAHTARTGQAGRESGGPKEVGVLLAGLSSKPQQSSTVLGGGEEDF